MNGAYILLITTVAIALFNRNKKILYPTIVGANLVGIYCGVASMMGLLLMAIFAAIVHFYNVANNSAIKWILWALIIAIAVSFASHMVPGFSNLLVLKQVSVSELSAPFSMYLNFDKTMCALIIYAFGDLCLLEQRLDKNSSKQVLIILLLCIAVVLTPALFLGYIKFDLKWPEILLIWAINNFFFVSFAEEVIFRGLIQNKLKNFIKVPYLHIIIASLLFGLAHFKGGWVYVILASICGFFYGYVYEKTNRILCSMMVHFCLNLTHLIFFTYPFAL